MTGIPLPQYWRFSFTCSFCPHITIITRSRRTMRRCNGGTPGRRAPYKDTLQPALHRRFSSTATLLLAVSYLEAVLLATWSSCKQTIHSTPDGVAPGHRPGRSLTCRPRLLVLVPAWPCRHPNGVHLRVRTRHPHLAHSSLPCRSPNNGLWPSHAWCCPAEPADV